MDKVSSLPQSANTSKLIDGKWTYSPALIVWNNVKKSSKTGQDYKNLLSIFTYFKAAIVKV